MTFLACDICHQPATGYERATRRPRCDAHRDDQPTTTTTPLPADPALAAGRELDCLIAERVFGREVVACTDTIHPAGYACPVWRYRVSPDDEPDFVSAEPAVPPYSTSIAAAWTVVERVLGMRLGDLTVVNVDVSASNHDPDEPPWYQCLISVATSLDVPLDRPTRFEGIDDVADTAPLAICRAALRASSSASGEGS